MLQLENMPAKDTQLAHFGNMLRGVRRFWLCNTPRPSNRGTGDNFRSFRWLMELCGLDSATSLSNLRGAGGDRPAALRPTDGEFRGVELTLFGPELEGVCFGFVRLGVEFTWCVGETLACSDLPVFSLTNVRSEVSLVFLASSH